jgi:dTDP-D-glucose 4,6-dehydratase
MGRMSHNKLIQEVTGWQPNEDLEKGIDITYKWIVEQIAKGNMNAHN